MLKRMFLLGLVLSLGVSCMAKDKKAGDPNEQKAINFTLKDLDGKKVSLKDYKNKKVVLLVFSATWCPYCVKEAPELKKLFDEINKTKCEILSVDIQESKEQVAGYVKEKGIHYRVLLDTDGSVATSYGVRGIPMNFLIDKKGYIKFCGNQAPPDVLEMINKLIK